MAFHIKAGEPLPDGIRRIVSEQIDTARTALAGGGPSEEDPVHEARKSCKKIRAILRLVRDHIGTDVYASENRIFRDIGRALSSDRDGTVLLETIDGLLDETDGAGARAELWALRGRLGRERESAVVVEVDPLLATLEETRSRVATWELEGSGFDAIRPGLRRTYRAGKRCRKQCRKKPDDRRLHELRKRAKELWYQLRLLESSRPEKLGSVAASLRELQERLGEDHDLALLIETAGETPDWADREGRERVARIARARREAARSEIWRLSKRIYKRKPDAFVRRVEAYREAWETQPASEALPDGAGTAAHDASTVEIVA